MVCGRGGPSGMHGEEKEEGSCDFSVIVVSSAVAGVVLRRVEFQRACLNIYEVEF